MTLGDVEVPVHGSFDLRTRFAPNVKETVYTMGDGSTDSQALFGSLKKLQAVITGSGPIPPGLDGLDYSQPMLFKSASERTLTLPAVSPAPVLPTQRRLDTGYEPWARAYVDGSMVQTPVVVTDDVATITPVADAEYYQLLYFPQFMAKVIGGGPITEDDARESETLWELSLVQQ